MGHTHSRILIHTIFSTAGRAPLIRDVFRERLYAYLGGLARKEFGHALKIGGTANHLHGLLWLRTDISVAEAMRKWKGLSSKWVHENLPGQAAFAWQEGYGAFSVSPSNEAAVIKYIAGQERHHKKKTFEEEFIAFLERHKIEYDPRHIWD